MSENEIKLIDTIRTQAHPEQALFIAINTILDFLAQDEPSQEQEPVCSRVSA